MRAVSVFKDARHYFFLVVRFSGLIRGFTTPPHILTSKFLVSCMQPPRIMTPPPFWEGMLEGRVVSPNTFSHGLYIMTIYLPIYKSFKFYLRV